MSEHFKKKPKKRYKLRPLSFAAFAIIGILLIAVLCGFYIKHDLQTKRAAQIVYETQMLAKSKAERIAKEARVEAERIAKEARIEAERIEAERVEAERVEAARIEAERVAEEKRVAQEAIKKKQAEDKARADKAKAEALAKEQARAKEEQSILAAEKAERNRISVEMRKQAARLKAEEDEYYALSPTPIVDLGILTTMQNPELPNGCEVSSLSTLLSYYGVYADKLVLADLHLPKTEFGERDKKRVGGDPDQVYCGNPRYKTGAYYCFVNPLIKAANSFFSSIGETTKTPVDITGANEATLIQYLDQRTPILAFTTLSMGPAYTYEKSKWLIDDTTAEHIPYMNLHCVVLHGYDEEFIYISDPLTGYNKCKRSSFMQSFESMGSRAMVIQ